MATKAAKSITINATKYELANTLDVANGKLQLKAKDVVLDEVVVKGGASWITLTVEYDFDAGRFAIKSLDCSDDIDPTTYTAQELYDDWTKGDLKIVLKHNAKNYLVNSVQDDVDHEGGVEAHYITIQSGGTDRDLNSNDKCVYSFNPDTLDGTDTIDTWTTTKNHFTTWTKLCTWS